jgi:hypothetical protein
MYTAEPRRAALTKSLKKTKKSLETLQQALLTSSIPEAPHLFAEHLTFSELNARYKTQIEFHSKIQHQTSIAICELLAAETILEDPAKLEPCQVAFKVYHGKTFKAYCAANVYGGPQLNAIDPFPSLSDKNAIVKATSYAFYHFLSQCFDGVSTEGNRYSLPSYVDPTLVIGTLTIPLEK